MKASKAKKLRELIELASEGLGDSEALEGAELFPVWDSGAKYEAGKRVRYDGTLYRCLQSHQAQTDWSPTAAPSLWARVLIEDPSVVSEWVQPDSTNPYKKGDRVSYQGKIWVSTCDGNVWAPGVYGWEVYETEGEA